MDLQVTIEPVAEKSTNPALDIPEAKTFPPGVDQITFGREKTCDVVFPANARAVSSMHGRLTRDPSGAYVLEAFGGKYFEVDGYEASRGQVIKDGSVIRLGNAKGPAVRGRVRQPGERTDGLARTLTQAGGEPVSKTIRKYGKALGGIAAALVLVVAFGAYKFATAPDLTTEIAALKESMQEQARGDFTSAQTEALRDAAFAVVMRKADGTERVLGTAWPYQPGMLVTNAHVAKAVDALKAGDTLMVRRPKDSEDFAVTGARVHPGYAAFAEFISETRQNSTGFRSMTEGLGLPSAYDVAILEVDPNADLGPMLEIESEPGPLLLTPGEALAFAGYPIEGTGVEQTAAIGTAVQLQFGHITSLTDYFMFGTDAEHAFLVQHSLPATGGASGSPIIDRSGKVVAILSGGNINLTKEGVRSPSAVLINFAQRADLVYGAADPSLFDLAAARKLWEQVIPRFDKHEVSVVASARQALETEAGGTVAETDKIEASLKSAAAVRAGPSQYRDHEIQVEAGHTYRFLVYGELGGSLSVLLFRGDQGIDANLGGSSFASLDYAAEKSETLKVRIVGKADNPVAYKLYTFDAPTTLADATPTN